MQCPLCNRSQYLIAIHPQVTECRKCGAVFMNALVDETIKPEPFCWRCGSLDVDPHNDHGLCHHCEVRQNGKAGA